MTSRDAHSLASTLVSLVSLASLVFLPLFLSLFLSTLYTRLTRFTRLTRLTRFPTPISLLYFFRHFFFASAISVLIRPHAPLAMIRKAGPAPSAGHNVISRVTEGAAHTFEVTEA